MPSPAVLSLNGSPQLVLAHATDDATSDATAGKKSTSKAGAGAATQRVMRLLGAPLRVKITDGRVVVGTFHCIDKHQNIILTDTREYLPLQRAGGSHNGNKKSGGGGGSSKHQKNQHEDDDADVEEKELWKTGTSRSLGMALVPGKHIVYVKVERTGTTTAPLPVA